MGVLTIEEQGTTGLFSKWFSGSYCAVPRWCAFFCYTKDPLTCEQANRYTTAHATKHGRFHLSHQHPVTEPASAVASTRKNWAAVTW